MPVHDVRIETDTDWCTIEILSTATWARAPGRVIRFDAEGSVGSPTLEVDDRVVTLRRGEGSGGWQRLVLQVATTEDRIAIRTSGGADGMIRLSTLATKRTATAAGTHDIVLFVNATTAESAGAPPGDSSLR
jgi:hypothetical protein